MGQVTNRRLRTEELASSTVVLQQDTQRVRGAFKARDRALSDKCNRLCKANISDTFIYGFNYKRHLDSTSSV